MAPSLENSWNQDPELKGKELVCGLQDPLTFSQEETAKDHSVQLSSLELGKLRPKADMTCQVFINYLPGIKIPDPWRLEGRNRYQRWGEV
jgi:hypothetical protein